MVWVTRVISSAGGTSNSAATPDADSDGVSGNSDNCPNNYNPSHSDNDGDGRGNVYDSNDN